MSEKYPIAVLAPFDSAAEGAQIPDFYSFPTSTQRLHTTSTLVADADGSFDLMLQPNLLYTAHVSNSTTFGLSSSLATWPVMNNGSANQSMGSYGVMSMTDLNNYAQYRVVGFGARLRSLLIPQTGTGVLYGASLPSRKYIPGDQFIGSAAATNFVSWSALQQTLLLPPASAPVGSGAFLYFDPVLQSLPTGFVKEAYELNQQGLEWSTKVLGPDAYQFRPGQVSTVAGTPITTNQPLTYGSATAVYDEGMPLQIRGNTHAVLPYGGFQPGYLANGDWSTLCLRGVGFPANATCFAVEIVFHIEYIDANITKLSNGRFPPVDYMALIKTADAAARMPMYRSLRMDTASKMKNFLGF